MSKKLATDEEVEAWGLRHAVRISSVSDMRAAFDDAATLHMVTTPTQAAQIEALAEVLTEVMEWIKNWDPQFVQDDEWGETKGKVERALSNTGKK